MNAPHTIWMTRPEPDGAVLANILEEAGYPVLRAPLLEIVREENVDISLLNGAFAVLITSANAVRALASLTPERDMRLICVGDISTDTARQLGFSRVESAAKEGVSNSALLAEYIGANITVDCGKLVHVSGSDVAGNLKGTLTDLGYHVERLVCYRAIPTPVLPSIPDADIVMFYSMRTAATGVGRLRDHDVNHITAICLSEQTAQVARALPFKAIHTLTSPDPQNLLSLLAEID